MSPNIDFRSVKGQDPVPEDWYPATIVDAKDAVSEKGNEMINVQWRIESGEFENRRVFDTLVFADSTLWRAKLALRALGFAADFSGAVHGEDLIGKSANILVVIEQSTQVDPDTGDPYEPRNRVKKIKGTSVAKGKKSKDLTL